MNLENFKLSKFYDTYKNTYPSDIILKNIFGQDVEVHKIKGLSSKSYEDIYNYNIDIMTALFELDLDIEDIWKMLLEVYIDPDAFSIRTHNKTECTADALFSMRRIFRKFGATKYTIEEYKLLRKYPIFHFPRLWGGINMQRAKVFGDRIDHTLLDLKNFYEKKDIRLNFAYSKSYTYTFLFDLETFENLIDWFGVKGIFVDDNYQIYDLEKGNGAILTQYENSYSWNWSDKYYNNLREKVKEYNKKSRNERITNRFYLRICGK